MNTLELIKYISKFEGGPVKALELRIGEDKVGELIALDYIKVSDVSKTWYFAERGRRLLNAINNEHTHTKLSIADLLKKFLF
jgi:hypothetical protein